MLENTGNNGPTEDYCRLMKPFILVATEKDFILFPGCLDRFCLKRCYGADGRGRFWSRLEDNDQKDPQKQPWGKPGTARWLPWGLGKERQRETQVWGASEDFPNLFMHICDWTHFSRKDRYCLKKKNQNEKQPLCIGMKHLFLNQPSKQKITFIPISSSIHWI